ncbi:hypothetical protein BBI17_007914 [Phytophthora kernoviae]|uniref:Uncharacterized protein n=1 Tax=Phytophthora kernoviae TaxID=325452 RepID=A0A421F6V6_9STRA|nr:hypothetical protein JM16_007545 [Phytophthora kernoviae]RLN26445.1 hypothetical protein BBI17_007914 [Phytophthora kernoviae]
MAQIRALLSGRAQYYDGGVRPMETKICLSADRAERRKVLLALRDTKLREAYRFLQARSYALNPTTPYFQEERFETAEGDFCISRFEIIPLRGVKGGVRAVYDAVLQAAFNAEIIISETSGNITIREEDDDLNDDNVSQMRLVSQTNRGALLENNLVHFSDFSPGESGVDGDKSSSAMTATDFVDEDDLYPYRPLERVRRDATAAMLVTSFMDSTHEVSVKGDNSRASLGDEEGEFVVVIKRWSCSRICHTDLDLPKQTVLELRESSMALLLPGEGWALESDVQHSPTATWGPGSDQQTAATVSTGKQDRIQRGRNSDENIPVKKKRIYKKRKPTHTIRKEEKQALGEEIQALEAKLEALKFQVLMQRGDKDKCLRKKEAHNSALRDVVQEQHLILAKARAMLLGCIQRPSYEVRPIEMYIHLTIDREERHETLKALRVPKIEYARRFIEHRSHGLHPTAEYFHEEKYESPEGDYCNVRFDRNPLRGVKGGIRAVANALLNAAFNAEIIISETSGNITIREDDDDSEENFSQMRLLTQSTRGVLVENNIARFEDMSHLGEVEGQDGAYALATTDFVDQDDRCVSIFPLVMTSIGAHYAGNNRSSMTSFPSSFNRQDSIEDDSEEYGADRHAAAALRGLSVRSKAVEQVSVKPDSESEASFESTAVEKPVKRKRIYKKRKATHTVRKEEKQALEAELNELQARLEELKVQTIVEGDKKEYSQQKRQARSEVLREAVHEQHLVLARAQAMLAKQSQQSLYRLHPTEMKIRLGIDAAQRIRTLSELRELKLNEARRFLVERTRGLDPTRPYFEEERYDTLDGDYCIARFDVTQFRGVRGGVREVFEAMKQTAFNAEIIISETSGNITIREDDELGDENLSQIRLVSQTPLGIQTETSLVVFSDYTQCQMNKWDLAEDGHYAIMASDFVDEDELHPYRPQERLRRDSTSVIMITSFREAKIKQAGIKTESEDELVVVATRWAITSLRKPSMDIPSHLFHDVRNAHGCWADLMYSCVRQVLGLPVIP